MLPVLLLINSGTVLLCSSALPQLGVQTANEEVADSGELCAVLLRGGVMNQRDCQDRSVDSRRKKGDRSSRPMYCLSSALTDDSRATGHVRKRKGEEGAVDQNRSQMENLGNDKRKG